MSILTVIVVPSGILMGADRNVTERHIFNADGREVQQIGVVRRPKVLRWPNRDALVGYMGLARIGDVPTDVWLHRFIGRHLTYSSLEEVAQALRGELQANVPSADIGNEVLIVHLAGFDDVGNERAPVVWFVRNAGLRDDGTYYVAHAWFEASEELRAPGRFSGQSASEIRTHLLERERAWNPFWFRQGYDLGVFNTLDHVLRQGVASLADTHPRKLLEPPTTLGAWSQYLKLLILTCGAYYEAYYPPYDQPVGGGVDVVSVPWP